MSAGGRHFSRCRISPGLGGWQFFNFTLPLFARVFFLLRFWFFSTQNDRISLRQKWLHHFGRKFNVLRRFRFPTNFRAFPPLGMLKRQSFIQRPVVLGDPENPRCKPGKQWICVNFRKRSISKPVMTCFKRKIWENMRFSNKETAPTTCIVDVGRPFPSWFLNIFKQTWADLARSLFDFEAFAGKHEQMALVSFLILHHFQQK